METKQLTKENKENLLNEADLKKFKTFLKVEMFLNDDEIKKLSSLFSKNMSFFDKEAFFTSFTHYCLKYKISGSMFEKLVFFAGIARYLTNTIKQDKNEFYRYLIKEFKGLDFLKTQDNDIIYEYEIEVGGEKQIKKYYCKSDVYFINNFGEIVSHRYQGGLDMERKSAVIDFAFKNQHLIGKIY